MHWGLRLALQAAIGAVAGGAATVWYLWRRSNMPQGGARIVRRLGEAPKWAVAAAESTGKGSRLGAETADTLGALGPNQGRFLELREYDLVSGTDYVNIPATARLTDEPTGVFVFCDSKGDHHMFTLGVVRAEISPADMRGGWVRAKMKVIDPPPALL